MCPEFVPAAANCCSETRRQALTSRVRHRASDYAQYQVAEPFESGLPSTTFLASPGKWKLSETSHVFLPTSQSTGQQYTIMSYSVVNTAQISTALHYNVILTTTAAPTSITMWNSSQLAPDKPIHLGRPLQSDEIFTGRLHHLGDDAVWI